MNPFRNPYMDSYSDSCSYPYSQRGRVRPVGVLGIGSGEEWHGFGSFNRRGCLQMDTEQCRHLTSASPTKRKSASKSASWLKKRATGTLSNASSIRSKSARTRKREAAVRLKGKSRHRGNGWTLFSYGSVSISASLDSGGSVRRGGVFGRRRSRQKPVQATNYSDTTTENSEREIADCDGFGGGR